MATNAKPVYRRILLKLSDGALQDIGGFGIDTSILDRMAQKIRELIELGAQVGVMIDRGNLFRGVGLAKAGMNRAMGNHMGMLATIMNGLATRDALHRAYVNICLMSATPLNSVCDSYSWVEAISSLRNSRVVILSVGIGNPFFAIDSTVRLCGIRTEADMVLEATKVDGMFIADLVKDPTVITYEQLTYSEALEKELGVMDLMTFTLTRDHKLPIRILNVSKPGALRRVVMGEKEGTLIME